MSHTTLVFVNLSNKDAFVYLTEADGDSLYAAKLAAGESTRQLAAPGEKWSVVSNATYPILADEKNRVFIIGSSGVYQVDTPVAIPNEDGYKPRDFDFPGMGGGGWP